MWEECSFCMFRPFRSNIRSIGNTPSNKAHLMARHFHTPSPSHNTRLPRRTRPIHHRCTIPTPTGRASARRGPHRRRPRKQAWEPRRPPPRAPRQKRPPGAPAPAAPAYLLAQGCHAGRSAREQHWSRNGALCVGPLGGVCSVDCGSNLKVLQVDGREEW